MQPYQLHKDGPWYIVDKFAGPIPGHFRSPSLDWVIPASFEPIELSKLMSFSTEQEALEHIYKRQVTVAEYVDALSKLDPLPDHHDALLKAHYQAKNHTVTATQLAEELGYESYRAVNLHYGKFAVALCEKLKKHEDFGILLESAFPNEENGHLELVMRPELVRAITTLGWYR